MREEVEPGLKTLDNTTAAILAGGLGTRLRSVVADRPKCLAPIGGRPFITYLLDQLDAAGVCDVVFCTGFLGEVVEESLGENYRNLSLKYSREPSQLGTAGALRFALPLFQSQKILVMNGDSYCDADLKDFVRWSGAEESAASLVLAETDDTHRFGRVDVRAGGEVARFLEKSSLPGRGWVNAGIYLLTRDLIESIPPNQTVSIERDIFPKLIGKGLRGFRAEATLWDIGVPDAYSLAKAKFAASICK